MFTNSSQKVAVLANTLGCMICALSVPSQAAFHLWDIREVYSNSDGSVQFIELFTPNNGQQFLNNHTLTSNANTFTFIGSSPAPTLNRHLLLATLGFASLQGAVTPDYMIPVNFFDPVSDFLNFAENSDTVNLTNVPTDGIMSLNYPGATLAANSPTNFAGAVGSLVPLAPADFDGDGDVDDDDLADWQIAYTSTTDGDADKDGDSDGADFLIWQRQFTGALPVDAVAIPEPTAAALLLISLTVLLGVGRVSSPNP